jgi:hypothetical protein
VADLEEDQQNPSSLAKDCSLGLTLEGVLGYC